MRSKEVYDAIEYLKYMNKNIDLNKIGYVYGNENLELVLNYISELENMLSNRIAYTQELEKDLFENCENYVVNKNKIRDKIKELESYKGLVMYEKYNYELIITNLKELLGE